MQAAYQEQVTHELVPRPRAQALLAGAGIVLALVVSAVNGMLFQQLEKAGATHIGALAFVLAFVAPGVVALVQAEKWDGQLPTVMPPGGTVPFLDLTSPANGSVLP